MKDFPFLQLVWVKYPEELLIGATWLIVYIISA